MGKADTKVINKLSLVAMRDEYEKIAVSIPAIARTGRTVRQGWRKAKGLYRSAKNYAKGLGSGLMGKEPALYRKLVNRNFTRELEQDRVARVRRGRLVPRPGSPMRNAEADAKKSIPSAMEGNLVGQAVRRNIKTVAPPYAGFAAGAASTKARNSPKPKISPVKAPKAPVVPNRADFINRQ